MYLMSLKTVVSKNRYNIQKSKQVGRYVKSSYSLLLESARRGNTKTYPIIKLYIEIFLFRERERKPVERHNRKPPSFELPREREREMNGIIVQPDRDRERIPREGLEISRPLN